MKALIALALITVAAAPASAADAASEARVVYKDLDLATEKGRATLDRRIAQAANALCGSGVQTGSRIRRGDVCLADAEKQFRAALAAKGVGAEVATR